MNKMNEEDLKKEFKSLRELPLCFCEFPNSANAPSSWHHQLLGKAEWIHQLLLNHLTIEAALMSSLSSLDCLE